MEPPCSYLLLPPYRAEHPLLTDENGLAIASVGACWRSRVSVHSKSAVRGRPETDDSQPRGRHATSYRAPFFAHISSGKVYAFVAVCSHPNNTTTTGRTGAKVYRNVSNGLTMWLLLGKGERIHWFLNLSHVVCLSKLTVFCLVGSSWFKSCSRQK